MRNCFSAMFCAFTLIGCDDASSSGTPDGPSGDCPTPTAERLLPLAVGNSWTYTVTELNKPTESKITTVEALEDVGGIKAGTTAYRIRTTKDASEGPVVSWQADGCTSVVRHREQSFDVNEVLLTDQVYLPSKLRVDETAAHTVAGAMWTTSYSEVETVSGMMATVSKDEAWSVVGVDVSVSVPAGTFVALQVQKITSGAANKTYWFAPGVGKVKEAGEKTEELTAFTVMP